VDKIDILKHIKHGLIVSCQALPDEPLHGPEMMARMALAASMGGAAGIRANSGLDIKRIKKTVSLPVIGIVKRDYPDSELYITPTMKEVDEVVTAGAEIVAIDATKRKRPGNEDLSVLVEGIRQKYDILLMADVSNLEEALTAWEFGFDLVSTTLSGYTSYSPEIEGPDFELIRSIYTNVRIPVIAEGRIWTPEDAKKCLDYGAFAVVVGAAVSRPQLITKRFVDRLSED